MEGDIVQVERETWDWEKGAIVPASEKTDFDPAVLPDFLANDASGEFYEEEPFLFFAAESFDLYHVAENYVQMLLDMGYEITETEEKTTRSFEIFCWYLSHPDVDGSIVNKKGQVCVKHQLSHLSGFEGTYIEISMGSGKCSHCNGTDQVKRLFAGTNTWLTQNCLSCSFGKCSFCNGRGY